jgi:spore coat polysaccharide biosynthesis protein SpsF
MVEIVPAIIQARFGSSRLRGKALLPLGTMSALERVIRRAGLFAKCVLLATSDAPEDEPLEALARSLGTPTVRGPIEDVHARFRLALEHDVCRGAEWFFRVTGDCPLLSERLAKELLEARDDSSDYLYFADEELPRGLAPELVRVSAFVETEPLSAPEREHVTLALYGRADAKRAKKLPIPEIFRHPELRLTLDYAEDARLFEGLFAIDDRISPERAVETLLARPDLSALNRGAETVAPHLL